MRRTPPPLRQSSPGVCVRARGWEQSARVQPRRARRADSVAAAVPAANAEPARPATAAIAVSHTRSRFGRPTPGAGAGAAGADTRRACESDPRAPEPPRGHSHGATTLLRGPRRLAAPLPTAAAGAGRLAQPPRARLAHAPAGEYRHWRTADGGRRGSATGRRMADARSCSGGARVRPSRATPTRRRGPPHTALARRQRSETRRLPPRTRRTSSEAEGRRRAIAAAAGAGAAVTRAAAQAGRGGHRNCHRRCRQCSRRR